VYVRDEKPVKFYVFLTKELFFNEKYKEVELHGVRNNIFNVLKVVQIMTKFKYATISKIKTKSITVGDSYRSAKLIITMAKSPEFEDLYTKYKEEVKASMDERYRSNAREV
jgi:type VI protein secretion system component Hcp